MAHLRAFKHSFHSEFLLLGALEFGLLTASVYIGFALSGEMPGTGFWEALPSALTFAGIMVLSSMAMGVYPSYLREGYTGMMLRTAVGFFLLGSLALSLIFYAMPALLIGPSALAVSAMVGFVGVSVLRWLLIRLIDDPRLKKRVLVLGTGKAAERIATRLRRRFDQRGFVIHGYLPVPGEADHVSEHGGRLLGPCPGNALADYCIDNDVQEIVVAVDDRRRALPIDALMDCRMSGISVLEAITFFEREVGKIELDLLTPSWLVFSDGFENNRIRNVAERILDVSAATALLLVSWPVMLLAALAIAVESGFRGPVFYRQERVGLNGVPYRLTKFRSMRTDAEKDGKAVWAAEDDPRVTRVGKFIRNTRIDELPQVFNVLSGDMSLVGPRPERPMFVSELEQQIPFYKERHRVKPGITGWAQLCYPYGASVEDARQKLQYDLYYVKNHSVLLDLIILIQTVEVVLVGDGAR